MSESNAINTVVRKKYGLPADWVWRKAVYYNGGAVVRGCVPTVITRGPRKGQLSHQTAAMRERYIVTSQELKAAREAVEGGAS